MKTLRLTLVALLIAGFSKAQYFQRVYGQPTSNDVLESGKNYTPGGPQPGYVMAGYTDWPSPGSGINSLMVTNTNLAGAPIFNNAYMFNDPVTGVVVSAQGRKIIKLPNANGQMAVWGDYSDLSTGVPNKFFYALVNPGGALAFVTTYVLPYMPQQVEATSITGSLASTGNVYVCGIITMPGGQKHPVALSLNPFNGAINWSHEYIDVQNNGIEWTAEDLVESPYPDPITGGIDIALAGRYVLFAGANGQGSVFLIDAATGVSITNQMYLYGNTTDDAGLNSIDIARNPMGGNGFICAGYSFNSGNGTYDSWALKTTTSCNAAIFTSMLDYSAMNRDDYGYDIIERLNTAGNWEYYLGGYVVNGLFGGEDEVVYKLNGMGMPVGGGDEFTYGGGGNERVLELDQFDFTSGVPGNAVGLSMFNYTIGSFPVIGQTDFYHVKSYYNGVTACNFILSNSNFTPGLPLLDSVKVDTIGSLQQLKLQWRTLQMRFSTICFANVVAGGNNARMAATTEAEQPSISGVFPNPVAQDNAVVNIKFDKPDDGENVQVELWNTLGQLCLQKTEVLDKDASQLELNLGNGLSKGIYHLVVRRGQDVLDYKISVQ